MKHEFSVTAQAASPTWIVLCAFLIPTSGVLLTGAPIGAADEVKPVAYWGFGQEESSTLESKGSVHRDVPGPRPDAYPDFSPDNTAVRLDGKGARFIYSDPGDQSPFDFQNGDEITLEAWVKVSEISTGEHAYVIGKGRTGSRPSGEDFQNWALRISEVDGRIGISFLFSTVPESPAAAARSQNWHRWTSEQGFQRGSTWHYIAISYRFGEPETIVGVIDGKQLPGHWDAGGPTRNPPTVDNAPIWIGSALGGTAANSFRGDLDEISIYRKALPAATLQARYRGPAAAIIGGLQEEQMPALGAIPQDEVLVTFHEEMPTHFRWLNEGESWPVECMRWSTNVFLMDRIPQRYDDWGIRADWKSPVLVRMAADVELPEGRNHFLMRVRGLSRLWVDGKLIARGNPIRPGQDGFEAMTPTAREPKPGLRIAEHRQQEVTGDFEASAAGTYRVVLETLVGGSNFRSDPGETCVALETPDGQSYILLQPGKEQPLSLTDETMKAALKAQERSLVELDDKNRRAAAASENAFWEKRHEIARKWTQDQPASAVPENPHSHPIDAFLQAKIDTALAQSSEASPVESEHFHKSVLPVLKNNCFRCHGERDRGGLRLNTKDGVLASGDSGLPAVHPGKAEASELISRIRSTSPEDRMPPGATPLSNEEIETLEKWVNSGAHWPAPIIKPADVAPTQALADAAFIRRLFLDTVGVIPTEAEVREFLQDPSSNKRTEWVDRLLADPRWADHWVSYWQDLLAENPTLINSSLNTTGPFRFYLYESLRDNKPIDRFVTELVLLRGSPYEGGSAGFGIAAENDAPFAAKGQILANAFLGIELQCARCHDSPYHSTKQKDLYALAAMFQQKAVRVPATSRVPAAFFEKKGRQSLIQVTLKPDEPVAPSWPFADVTGCVDDETITQLMHNPRDTREKLAALLTSPKNQRFAEVLVNRVWRRYLGSGIVEPPEDWEGRIPSHPELLNWLAQEFVSHGYDLKYVSRLILTSDLYQREAIHTVIPPSPELKFFTAPERRRMSAEQVVDSLCVAVGQELDVEEMTFAPEAGRPSKNRLSLGKPDRAWKFANLANERDRPSLSLPRARAIADIMEAFGWNGARQSPRTDRESDPNVLQPGILQNSEAAVLLTRVSTQSDLAELAIESGTPEELIDRLSLRVLSRFPTDNERALLAACLAEGFDQRILPQSEWVHPKPLPPLPVVTWSNHVQPEANTIAVEMENRARTGPPADPRLHKNWREAYEDVVWGMINLSEFVWIP